MDIQNTNPNMNNPMNRFNNSMNGMGRFNSTNRPNFGGNRFRNMNMDTTTAPILLGVGGSLLFLSLTLLIARLWSRLRPVVRLHADDWTLLGGALLAIVSYAFLSSSVVHGLGRRMRFVHFSRRRSALRLLFISQVFWYWSITLVKLSVACLLLRVKHAQRWWRVFLYAIMTLLVAAAIVQTCFQFLQCRPFSVFWDPRVFRQGEVKCFRRRIINVNIVAFSALQVFVDLVFSFIPITFIRKLNRPRREKIFMCVLMALGLFASCAAIVRTLTLYEFYTTTDLFRTNVNVALFAVVELQFALIAATIPTLKAVLEKALLKVGSFFYEERNEKKARAKLVAFGLLGRDECAENGQGDGWSGWRLSKGAEEKNGNERRVQKLGELAVEDEGDGESINDKEVEKILATKSMV